MPAVVITGASGFVGHHLAEHLAANGYEPIRVSRRIAPRMTVVRDYSESPAAEVLIHLAEQPDRARVNQIGEDYLLHSAAVVSALVRHSGQKLIYASSGVVYSDLHESPRAVDAPVYGTDVYSRSKLFNEQIVLDAGGIVVRLSNLFGSGMGANNVMSDIMRQIPGSGPLQVRDDTPVRDFLSVADACSAFGLMVDSGFSGILNLGSGMGTSIRALAELSLDLAGEGDRRVEASQPSARRSVNVLDISETKTILNWAPNPSLKNQLSEFFEEGKASQWLNAR